MQFIINELSLTGQYTSLSDFTEKGVKPMAQLLVAIFKEGNTTVLKKSDLWSFKVTKDQSFNDILYSQEARINDQLRKFKSIISKLYNEPFWDVNPQQALDAVYWAELEGKKRKVSNTCLAEAHARDASLLSFPKSCFTSQLYTVELDASKKDIINIFQINRLYDHLLDKGTISFESYCRNMFNTKLCFDFISNDNGFNLIDGYNINVFKEAFEKFESLSWREILEDNGLQYKEFNRNRRSNKYFPLNLWNKGIFKFYVNQKYRCFGYKQGEVFYVIRFDLEHKLSDNG